MNIFATSVCPVESARFLDDRRLVKMVLESVQLLSGAVRLELGDYAPAQLYKVSHKNHPCAVWTRASRGNYLWLLEHAEALAEEYAARFSKVHKSAQLLPALRGLTKYMQDGERTPFADVTGVTFDRPDFFGDNTEFDTHVKYRLCLYDKWAKDIDAGRPPTWNRLRATDYVLSQAVDINEQPDSTIPSEI